MADDIFSSDVTILDLLRKRGGMTVLELAGATSVTATAVRQRLTRLMAQRYLERQTSRSGRGRPSHRYVLTDAGRRKTGSNFADLAIALWHEVREIKDLDVRRGLLQRLAVRLADLYSPQVTGATLDERLDAVANLFSERQIPFAVDRANSALPVLTTFACPYPDLAEQDRTICSLERILFSRLVGENLRLTSCRLDGSNCCTFATAASGAGDGEENQAGNRAGEN